MLVMFIPELNESAEGRVIAESVSALCFLSSPGLPTLQSPTRTVAVSLGVQGASFTPNCYCFPQAAALARELMSASEGEEEDEEVGDGSQTAHGDDLPELPEGFAYSGRRKVSICPFIF